MAEDEKTLPIHDPAERLGRPYWGAAAGKSAVDSAWILAADNEQNVCQDRYVVTVVADYSKYYETIGLDQARDKLMRLGMPGPMVKVVYNQWKGPRIIRMRLHHGGAPRHARDGLPAGDAYADVVVKAHALEQHDIFISLHPLVRFASYIDDTSLGVNSSSKDMVIDHAVHAAKGFCPGGEDIGGQCQRQARDRG